MGIRKIEEYVCDICGYTSRNREEFGCDLMSEFGITQKSEPLLLCRKCEAALVEWIRNRALKKEEGGVIGLRYDLQKVIGQSIRLTFIDGPSATAGRMYSLAKERAESYEVPVAIGSDGKDQLVVLSMADFKKLLSELERLSQA